MAKYNQNMVDKIQNFKHAGKDSFNSGVKSLNWWPQEVADLKGKVERLHAICYLHNFL